MLRKLTSTSSSWAPVPLRLALGIIFIAHGSQLVFGAWGGPGLSGFASFPSPFPFMRPAWLWMGAAALSQLIGGILIVLGLFTRLGAVLLAAVMLVAMFGAHWPAFFLPNGLEFTLALTGMAFALLITGGGQASLDRMIGGGRRR
jgi:putative oxidoreductase